MNVKLKGSTGKMSRVIKFNLFMKGLTAVHGSLHMVAPLMTTEQFAIVSIVLLFVVTTGNEYLRTLTTGPLHNGDQL